MVLVQKKDPEVRRACPFEGKEAPTEGVKSFSLPLLCRERAPPLGRRSKRRGHFLEPVAPSSPVE